MAKLAIGRRLGRLAAAAAVAMLGVGAVSLDAGATVRARRLQRLTRLASLVRRLMLGRPGLRPRRPFLARSAAIVVVSATAVLSAGCGSDDLGSVEKELGSHRDLATYALPLDEVSVSSSTWPNYVENVLVKNCMDSKGVEWTIPAAPDVIGAAPKSTNRFGRRIFDLKVASELGYRQDGGATKEQLELNSRKLTDQQQAAFNECVAKMRKEVPAPPQSLVFDYASAAYSSTMADPEVLDATEKWRRCLSEQGYGQYVEGADNYGDVAVKVLEELYGTDSPTSDEPVAAKEIEVATADAKCQESTGYLKLVYSTEYDEQLRQAVGHESQLRAQREATTHYTKKIDQIAASLGLASGDR